MYNRYIPQPDGSFRRRRVPDPPRPTPPPKPPRPEQNEPGPDVPPPVCPPQECAPPEIPVPPPPPPHPGKRPNHRPPPSHQENNVGTFLKNLLPDSFDTGDLFIVLLLLLMAGDCEEDKNTALLTLALYFLM